MSHPDPLHDEENTMSQDSFDRFDDMAERTIWPWIDDANYDDHDAFCGEDSSSYHPDADHEVESQFDDSDDDFDDSMDGDHDSAMESAGWGTDEDYGYYGEDY